MRGVLLLTLAFSSLAFGSAALADYDSCTYDAAKRQEECLRSAAETGSSDAVCQAQFQSDWEDCQALKDEN
jgi:hypothetical protein